ncbi:hypothetical protein AWW67_09340 [Roseivirga seohaensis]|uniref:Cadherin domain-containing protein n=1 Tax=Roseivirga seohaensis TaxID=1914963 RepID=A0A150XNU4_9BACT|nr:Ig-like domain-containing protein [Roseivirga seohaensis]KYG80374.1 hypothetical protein AWW67_09340 [Roseivirga seohaensis]
MNTSSNALISFRLPQRGLKILIILFLSVFFSKAEAQIAVTNSLSASDNDGAHIIKGASNSEASITPFFYSGMDDNEPKVNDNINYKGYISNFASYAVPVPVTVIDFNGEGWSYLDRIGESLTRSDFVFSQYNSALNPVSMMADVFGEGRSKGLYIAYNYLVIKKTDGSEFDFQSMYVVGDNNQTISIAGYRNTKAVVTTSVSTSIAGTRISPSTLDGRFVNVDSVVVSNTAEGLGGGYDSFNFAPPTDLAPPDVKKILVAGSPSGRATSIDYTVSFYENANNLSTDDFQLTKTGTAEGTISAISASSGTSVNVTVSSISGEGTLRLDVKSNTNITDDLGNGNNNNGYVQAYTDGVIHAVDFNNPVFTSATTANFTENGTGTAYTVAATDANTITYSLGNAKDEALFNIVGATGVVTFKNAPDYENPADGNTDNAYVINVIANDGTNSVNQDVTITVTDIDEINPVLTSATTANFAENGTGTAYTVAATDANTITYSLGNAKDEALFNIVGATGVVTFKNAPDYENPADGNTDNAYVINVIASDGTNSVDQDVTITVTDIDEINPVLTSATTANFAENGTGTVYTVAATDANTITYSLGNAKDEALFNIVGATGVVTFKNAPDYENPADGNTDNAYVINVIANDGTNSVNQDVTITVTDIDEINPVFTSATTANFAENGTGTAYTVAATDANTITYSLGNAKDEALFNIVGATGIVTFKNAPDYENPADGNTDNAYVINVIANDGTNSVNQDVTITVTDIDEINPVLTSATTANFAENGTGTAYTVAATDANTITYSLGNAKDEALFNIVGATGVVTFKNSPDYENPADGNTDNAYVINVIASDGTNSVNQDVTITVTDIDEVNPVFTSATTANFAENGTGTAYTVTATDVNTITYSLGAGNDEALFDIVGSTGLVTFKNSPDYENPADGNTDNAYVINVIANDGTNSVNQDVTITVTDIDEINPVLTSATTANFAENGTGTAYTVTATDANTITYSLGNTKDEALFNIVGATGIVTFKNSPDYENPADGNTDNAYVINVIANDGTNSVNQDVTITVTDIDEIKPTVTITSASTTPNSGAFDITVTFNESVTGFVIGDLTVANGTASNFAGSGTTYTATITPSADGAVTVDVAAGVAQDAAANTNTAATQFSITNDETKPTVTVTSASTSPNSGAFDITVTFSESVTGFVVGDLTVANGVASNFAGSGTTYTATITPSADGAVTVDVAAGVAQDVANNTNTAATQFSITNDETKPTVTIVSSSTSPISGAFNVAITFSESVTGFVIGDLTVVNGTASNFAGSGITYTATITPSADGVVTVDVAAGVAQDAASNTNTVGTQFSITNDETKPTVTVTSASITPNSGAFDITVTFSESVTGFVVGDLAVANGTASNFAGSGTTYTATVTPSADGDVTVNVAAGVAQDAATNTNTAATQFSITNDETKPTVTVTSSSTSPTSGAFNVTITFNESVTGFVIGDLTVANGTASNFAGSGTTYTATITPSADGVVTVDVAAGVAQDAATNTNTAATQFSITNDETKPTVTIASASTTPNSGVFDITVTFNESVTGFVIGDLTVINGTASNFAGSGTTYTATITPSADGVVTVDVAAGVAQDVALNTNTATTQFSITNDETKPTVTVTSSSTSPNSGAFDITVTFNESVTGFVIGDLIVANGTASNFAGSGATYTATITPSADGVVTVDVAAGVAQDAATNTNTAATQFSITNDETKPTVTIASSSTSPTSGAFNVTITFSESVTGFVIGDLTVANGTASNFAGSGTTYTATITPSADGVVTVDVAAGVAQDAATNTNTAATQFSITNDETKPTVTVTSSSTSPTSGDLNVTITFSESVTGFVIGDLTVVNGTASNFAGSGTTYTATITPSADGAVTVNVAAGVAQDFANNLNLAAIQFSIINDQTKPSVSLTAGSSNPVAGSYSITAQFSEAVMGFSLTDIIVTGGTASSFVVVDADTYTFSVTSPNSSATVNIEEGVAIDVVGNYNTASNSLSLVFNLAPISLALSNTSISENNSIGQLIGNLSTTDADVSDTHTYSLVSGIGADDNSSFTVVGNKLQAAEVFDFEIKTTYSIRIKTDDGRGGTSEKQFTISITNIEEPEVRIESDYEIPATALGLTSNFDITIHNDGDALLMVNSVLYPDGFVGLVTGLFINPGESKVVTLGFMPTEAKVYTGTISFITNAGTASMTVSGKGAIITGVDDGFIDDEEINLFPNPAQDILNIDLSELGNRTLNISIINASGTSVFTKTKVTEKSLRLNVSDYTNGLYIVQFTDGISVVRKKVMIKK